MRQKVKITLCRIKCSKFEKNSNIKMDGKINLYCHCIGCGFKKELSDLLKI